MNKIISISIGNSGYLPVDIYVLFIRKLKHGYNHRTFINVTNSSLRRLIAAVSWKDAISINIRQDIYNG